jgi:hypothetical protein
MTARTITLSILAVPVVISGYWLLRCLWLWAAPTYRKGGEG